MTRYAAYDEITIYALGDTPEAAIAQAIEDTRGPDASFLTAPVSEELAAYIDSEGWDGGVRSFELRDGVLVDTTPDEGGWFAFRAYNAQALYGYGTQAEANRYEDIINAGRGINVFHAYALSDEEARDLNLDDNTESIILYGELLAREEE